MATQFNYYTRSALLTSQKHRHPLVVFTGNPLHHSRATKNCRGLGKRTSGIRVSNGGDSYLDMWKKAVDRERKTIEFQKLAENSAGIDEKDEVQNQEVLQRRSSEFKKILEVSAEERDRVQRMQVIDRAAAAISAARAILKERSTEYEFGDRDSFVSINLEPEDDSENRDQLGGSQVMDKFVSLSGNNEIKTPGPNFWTWTPPEDNDIIYDDEAELKSAKSYPSTMNTSTVMELEQQVNFLSIPFESKLENSHNPPLPPLQSLMEVQKLEEASSSIPEMPHLEEERELGVQFSTHAAEAANALNKMDYVSSQGTHPDGSRWWKETGLEVRPDGVVCRWTLTRGVSADKSVEWEEKYWEASDEFDYKELGSEKSGRDAAGNVWREFWKETMYQKEGCVHLEKTANKWGKNDIGNEWQEKWWESYGAGQAEKWAHKWCSIDPNTPLDAGHAHVWHERWGEKYDGQGGSVKYTDKWAERSEGDGWMKWGDKWDEHFDPNGHGVKQGETWWEGKYGERWNRTWGEGHNGSGWVHKYGKSSSGEHWDTHEQQDTWYERYPHYGFYHCFENSVPLRSVKKPSESS